MCQESPWKKENEEGLEIWGAGGPQRLSLQLSLVLHRKVRHLGCDNVGLRGVRWALGKKMEEVAWYSTPVPAALIRTKTWRQLQLLVLSTKGDFCPVVKMYICIHLYLDNQRQQIHLHCSFIQTTLRAWHFMVKQPSRKEEELQANLHRSTEQPLGQHHPTFSMPG